MAGLLCWCRERPCALGSGAFSAHPGCRHHRGRDASTRLWASQDGPRTLEAGELASRVLVMPVRQRVKTAEEVAAERKEREERHKKE